MRKPLVLLEKSISKKLPLVFVKHMTILAAAAPTINPSEMIKRVLESVILTKSRKQVPLGSQGRGESGSFQHKGLLPPLMTVFECDMFVSW